MPTIITTKELQQLIRNKVDYLLIDVRNKDELIHGMIPTAKNIPLPEVEHALDLTPEAFEKKYHFKKPTKQDSLIFHCRSGGRSQQAAMIAENRGYQAKNYAGSIWEWSEIDKNVKRYGPAPHL